MSSEDKDLKVRTCQFEKMLMLAYETLHAQGFVSLQNELSIAYKNLKSALALKGMENEL